MRLSLKAERKSKILYNVFSALEFLSWVTWDSRPSRYTNSERTRYALAKKPKPPSLQKTQRFLKNADASRSYWRKFLQSLEERFPNRFKYPPLALAPDPTPTGKFL